MDLTHPRNPIQPPTTMTDKDHVNVSRLLHHFNAETLGDGNLAAGANLLAAMALTIANIQRPGSAIVTADGSRIAPGCGFVVSDSLTSSLFAELVISPMQVWQNALCDNVRHFDETVQREREIAARKDRQVEADPEVDREHRPSLENLMRPSLTGDREDRANAMRLLDAPPGMGVREIQNQPLVFGTAGGPETIAVLMESAHLGQLLLHVPLHKPGDSDACADACSRLLDGRFLPDPVARTVRGYPIVTDPHRMLGDAARSRGAGAGWLSRLCWLTNHAAGPAFERPLEVVASEQLDRVTVRFHKALREAFGDRLNAASGRPEMMELDLKEHQAEWIKFLAARETAFPGITGTLRPLPASLVLGLWKIRTALPTATKAFHVNWVYAFARLLAQRMSNARQVMMRDARFAKIAGRADAIRRKLADGPLTVREIARRSNRLTADECEETLEHLAATGLVTRTGKVWSLTPHAAAHAATQTLTVDV